MAQSYSARSRAIEPFHVMALLARRPPPTT
jgi:hypothetical protein